MSMQQIPHHCTISKNGLRMYFINSKRVSKHLFNNSYPDFNDELCLTSIKRNRIRQSIKILKSIEKDLGGDGPLSQCQQNLRDCNDRIVLLENRLLDSVTKFERQISQLRSQESKKDCSREIENMNREIDKLRSYLEKCTNERKRYVKELTDSELKQQELSKTHNQSLADLQEARDNYNKELEEKILIQKEVDKLKSELKTLKDKKERQDTQQKLLLLQNELDLKNKESVDLSQRLFEVEKRTKEFREELRKLIIEKDKNLDEDDDLLRELSIQINDLQQRLAISESEKEMIKKTIDEKTKELETLRLSKSSLDDRSLLEQITKLEYELGTSSSRLVDLSEKFRLLSKEKDELLLANKELLETKTTLEQEYNLNKELSKSQLENYEKERQVFNLRLEEFQRQKEEFNLLKTKNTRLYGIIMTFLNLDRQSPRNLNEDNIEEELRVYTVKHNSLLEQNNRIIELKNSLSQQLDEIKRENESLKLQIRKLPEDEAKSAFNERIEKLQQELTTISNKKLELENALETERKDSAEENLKLSQSLKEARQQIEELEQKNQELLDKLTDVNEKDASLYAQLQDTIKLQNERILSLDKDNAELRKRIDDATESLRKCEEAKSNVEEVLSELQEGTTKKESLLEALREEKRVLDDAYEKLKTEFDLIKPKDQNELDLLKKQKQDVETLLNTQLEENKKLLKDFNIQVEENQRLKKELDETEDLKEVLSYSLEPIRLMLNKEIENVKETYSLESNEKAIIQLNLQSIALEELNNRLEQNIKDTERHISEKNDYEGKLEKLEQQIKEVDKKIKDEESKPYSRRQQFSSIFFKSELLKLQNDLKDLNEKKRQIKLSIETYKGALISSNNQKLELEKEIKEVGYKIFDLEYKVSVYETGNKLVEEIQKDIDRLNKDTKKEILTNYKVRNVGIYEDNNLKKEKILSLITKLEQTINDYSVNYIFMLETDIRKLVESQSDENNQEILQKMFQLQIFKEVNNILINYLTKLQIVLKNKVILDSGYEIYQESEKYLKNYNPHKVSDNILKSFKEIENEASELSEEISFTDEREEEKGVESGVESKGDEKGDEREEREEESDDENDRGNIKNVFFSPEQQDIFDIKSGTLEPSKPSEPIESPSSELSGLSEISGLSEYESSIEPPSEIDSKSPSGLSESPSEPIESPSESESPSSELSGLSGLSEYESAIEPPSESDSKSPSGLSESPSEPIESPSEPIESPSSELSGLSGLSEYESAIEPPSESDSKSPSGLSESPSEHPIYQILPKISEFIGGKSWTEYDRFYSDKVYSSIELAKSLIKLLRICRTRLLAEIEKLKQSYATWLGYTNKEKIKQLNNEIVFVESISNDIFNIMVNDDKKDLILKASKDLRESDYFSWRYKSIPVYMEDYRNEIEEYPKILKKLEDKNRVRDLYEVLNEIVNREIHELKSSWEEEKKYKKQELKDFKEKYLDLDDFLLKTDMLKKELDKLKKRDKLTLSQELEDTMLEGLAFRNKGEKRKSRRLPTRK